MAFIAFEGLDGSGKSTLIDGLQRELSARKLAFQVTREPGGTPLGDEIRRLLLRTEGDVPTPRAELLLYEAIRAQHVEKLIRPALAEGQWILCDRFDASSIAFQAGGRSNSHADVVMLNAFATGGLQPHLYVLLDLTVEEAQRRMSSRSELDRFEQEQQDFHQRVRGAYLQLAKSSPTQWLVLDAQQSPAQLLGELLQQLKVKKWLI